MIMDARTGEIKFMKDEEEVKDLNKGEKGRYVRVKNNRSCDGCPAYKIDSKGKGQCSGGSRKERRELYKCRSTVINSLSDVK